MAFNLQPALEEKGAGWTDVLITFFVCATIAIVAIYVCIRFFNWKQYMYDQDIAQKNKKREWEIEDIKRKQFAEYLNKELDLLEEKKDKLEKINNYIQDLGKP